MMSNEMTGDLNMFGTLMKQQIASYLDSSGCHGMEGSQSSDLYSVICHM